MNKVITSSVAIILVGFLVLGWILFGGSLLYTNSEMNKLEGTSAAIVRMNSATEAAMLQLEEENKALIETLQVDSDNLAVTMWAVMPQKKMLL